MKLTKEKTEKLSRNIAVIIRSHIHQTGKLPSEDQMADMIAGEINREAAEL